MKPMYKLTGKTNSKIHKESNGCWYIKAQQELEQEFRECQMSERQEGLELLYGKNYKKELPKEQILLIERLLYLEQRIDCI